MRKIVTRGITSDPGKPDKGVTLWNIVRKYVRKEHPKVPIDKDNSVAGCFRFRIEVLKNEVVITDSGKSPGILDPVDFPRKTINASDPDFFKKLSKVLKRGNVCIYRKKPRKYGSPYGNKTAWIMMSTPDLVAMHSADAEAALIDAIATEIKNEIDEAIINDLAPIDIGDRIDVKRKRKK